MAQPADLLPYIRLRQICLVAPEIEAAAASVSAIFGLPVCFRDANVGKFGLANVLFTMGHSFLEIVAPTREDTAAGRFLERSQGRGGYMAIFDTSDPERRLEHAQRLGIRIAHVIDYQDLYGIQLHPRDCRAAMLEFDRTDGAQDLDGPYHPAGPDWRAFQRLDRVCGMPWVEVESPAPQDLARHWSTIIDRPLFTDAGGRLCMNFDLGGLRFVKAPAGTPERLSTIEVAVSDPAAVLEAARRNGCDLAAGRFRLCGVDFRPVA